MTIHELQALGISDFTALRLATRGVQRSSKPLREIEKKQAMTLAALSIRLDALEIELTFKGIIPGTVEGAS